MIQHLFSKVEFSWADICRAVLFICVKVAMNALVIALSIIVGGAVLLVERLQVLGERWKK